MNLLLDTHVWVWGLLTPGRLPREVRSRLESEDDTLWISPITVWEACVFAEKGRLRVAGDRRSWIAAAYTSGRWQEAPLTCDVAFASRDLRVATEDPADRFLAATAKVQGLTPLTADARLKSIPGVDVLAFTPRPA